MASEKKPKPGLVKESYVSHVTIAALKAEVVRLKKAIEKLKTRRKRPPR